MKFIITGKSPQGDICVVGDFSNKGDLHLIRREMRDNGVKCLEVVDYDETYFNTLKKKFTQYGELTQKFIYSKLGRISLTFLNQLKAEMMVVKFSYQYSTNLSLTVKNQIKVYK